MTLLRQPGCAANPKARNPTVSSSSCRPSARGDRLAFHVKHRPETSPADNSNVGIESQPAPRAAQEAFGEQLPLAQRYVALLVSAGVERGLLGPREAARIWDRHLLNCAVIHPAIPTGCTIADIGSGAGLPGMVLAIVRPDLAVTLVEPMQRRCEFLSEVIGDLRLPNVTVRRARAETLGADLTVDVVTARAVAPLERLARWAIPLLSPGGRLLALKGRSVMAELTRAAPVLRTLGATEWRVDEYGSGIVDPPTRVAIIEVGARVSEAVSRRRAKGNR
jgi:16S rRNA (guanine527-N7)-methyltransferase